MEKDGSGDVTHIQAAIDRLGETAGPAVILVGAGEFREKLLITRHNITFAGLGRDKTSIVSTQLRAEWRKTHDDDWAMRPSISRPATSPL